MESPFPSVGDCSLYGILTGLGLLERNPKLPELLLAGSQRRGPDSKFAFEPKQLLPGVGEFLVIAFRFWQIALSFMVDQQPVQLGNYQLPGTQLAPEPDQFGGTELRRVRIAVRLGEGRHRSAFSAVQGR
jgi:hypothetical protein